MSDNTSPQPDLFAGQVAVDQHRSVWTSTDGRRWHAYGAISDRGWTPDELITRGIRLTEVVPATRVTELEAENADLRARLAKAVTLPDRLIDAWSHRLDAIHADVRRLGEPLPPVERTAPAAGLQERPICAATLPPTETLIARLWGAINGWAETLPRGQHQTIDAVQTSARAHDSIVGAVRDIQVALGSPHHQIDAAMSATPTGCPTCTGPVRETAGMVCQTCGTDYGPDAAAATEEATA